MSKILFVGAEVMPFAATGGLGDVLGSLPTALAAEKNDVRVIMPLYKTISQEWRQKMKKVCEFYVQLSWRNQYCGIYTLTKEKVIYYFIDNEYYFCRDSLYGHYDDAERYAYLSLAALESMKAVDFYPDILHAHDWQAAMSVVYLNCLYRGREGYDKIKTVFTIHNIEYQGNYDPYILGDVFGLSEECLPLMTYDNRLNLMKAAIVCADRVSTVSPRYAEEICTGEYGHGLDSILRDNQGKLCGILNGIDYKYYNPEKDTDIAVPFKATCMDGKYENKLALQKELHLPEDKEKPVLSIISRLASHKGLDIVTNCIYDIVNNNDVQLVVLGKGEPRYEEYFRQLEVAFPNKVRALITYDRKLSKRIYAATDIFLMPSKSEPCGLSQMIASRYGAIPVVRETGGLYNSIQPYWMEGKTIHGNGFTFANYSSDELKERTEAALSLFGDKQLKSAFVKKIMKTDFSWKNSAVQYIKMYENLLQ